MIKNDVIFREYDIRGVVGKDFDIEFARQLGRSFVQYFRIKQPGKFPRFTVGYDARVSSVKIAQAICDGLTTEGADAIQLGLVTSPISYFSTFHLPGVEGAIMVTGSHNPPEYNGFKLSLGRKTIFGEEIQNLKKYFAPSPPAATPGRLLSYDIFGDYLKRYQNEFQDLSGVPVVFDCGNGAAGVILGRLCQTLKIDSHILFEKPDGLFPNHHPDPTVEENLVDLIKEVKKRKALAGIGYDGDADRIGVVDHDGNMVFGDELMVIFARDILGTLPKAKIIGDVKCSNRMYQDVKERNGQPIMWKTGHSLIKNKILEEGAPFGGELSGHIFFADRNYGYDDALYAGLRLIQVMKQTGKNIPQLLSGLPKAFNTPEIRIDTTEEKKQLIVQKIAQHYSAHLPKERVNLLDGVRVTFDDGWALARPSNTQPVLVLRFEAQSEESLANMRQQFASIIGEDLV